MYYLLLCTASVRRKRNCFKKLIIARVRQKKIALRNHYQLGHIICHQSRPQIRVSYEVSAPLAQRTKEQFLNRIELYTTVVPSPPSGHFTCTQPSEIHSPSYGEDHVAIRNFRPSWNRPDIWGNVQHLIMRIFYTCKFCKINWKVYKLPPLQTNNKCCLYWRAMLRGHRCSGAIVRR